ncbi:MAG: hypothetical protein KDG54_16650 [Geminicoccaceae bacterium]|nr:hypothetical protein [Geminicoccaceae bacterium]
MSDWLDPVFDWLAANGSGRALFVAMPSYRPELIRALAEATGFDHCDFRREVMAKAGSDPATLPLSLIEETIAGHAARNGLVLQNVESLLATRSAEDRSGWIARMVAIAHPLTLIFPIALFNADLPDDTAVIHIAPDALPADTLMMRLWGSS